MEHKTEIELSMDIKKRVEAVLSDLVMFAESPHISELLLRESMVECSFEIGSLLGIEVPDWKDF